MALCYRNVHTEFAAPFATVMLGVVPLEVDSSRPGLTDPAYATMRRAFCFRPKIPNASSAVDIRTAGCGSGAATVVPVRLKACANGLVVYVSVTPPFAAP